MQLTPPATPSPQDAGAPQRALTPASLAAGSPSKRDDVQSRAAAEAVARRAASGGAAVLAPLSFDQDDSSTPGSSADTEPSVRALRAAAESASVPTPSTPRAEAGSTGANAADLAASSEAREAAATAAGAPELWQPTEEVLRMVVRWLQTLDDGVYRNRQQVPGAGRPGANAARQYLSVHKVAALLAGAWPPLLCVPPAACSTSRGTLSLVDADPFAAKACTV